ncbi:MAG: DUF6623 family protein [Ignavibacteriales bacterium]
MPMHASWVHGNALTVESPENLARVGHYGWGADMLVQPGKGSWFHIALPTPVITGDIRTKLYRVFLLFRGDSGSIRNVHVYDGSSKIQEFNDLMFEGEHRLVLDGQNTFNLATPHTVAWGVGISFFFVASIGFDTTIPPARLILGAAGGDFFT